MPRVHLIISEDSEVILDTAEKLLYTRADFVDRALLHYVEYLATEEGSAARHQEILTKMEAAREARAARPVQP